MSPGYEFGVVRLLLEREDVNPGTRDVEYGQTPLMLAARNGYEGVMKWLLEREDNNANSADTENGKRHPSGPRRAGILEE